MKLIPLCLIGSHVRTASCFSITLLQTTISSNIIRNDFIKTELRLSANESSEESSLFLGEDVQKSIESLGQGDSYLQAARARNNEEARLRLLEQERLEEEEAERKRRARKENGNESNFGPGDLSTFKGFIDDGFEASQGSDEEGAWGEIRQNEETSDENEPKLFLFGDEDGSDNDSGLIL